jgi:uncharacterized protein YndB with AHSA1/START domain
VTPDKLFAAFAEERWVSRWLSPSPEIKLNVLRFDFTVGGAYRFAYEIPGGDPVIVHGVYSSIEAPRKIVFSWIIEPPDEHAGILSEVTVLISPDGDGTELLIRHEKLLRADAAKRHSLGWQGALKTLSALIEIETELT